MRADVASSVVLALLVLRGYGVAWALLVSLVVDIGEFIEELPGCRRSAFKIFIVHQFGVLHCHLLGLGHEMRLLDLNDAVLAGPDHLLGHRVVYQALWHVLVVLNCAHRLCGWTYGRKTGLIREIVHSSVCDVF